jgi:hypothetical protein
LSAAAAASNWTSRMPFFMFYLPRVKDRDSLAVHAVARFSPAAGV